ncbi:VWA domain-containing protein [Cryomorpha ignava]|uniref:VWA domain-containing protein n=1 Tax=Cryomorpha ignava TaxID=101383 RepID=A0A7K3WVA5_9FLAO|nr:VWA domain-containing protein [Cryomorpha ignava]NEN24842.1 VWA domain-containing protein [Cryomorpha ignava]
MRVLITVLFLFFCGITTSGLYAQKNEEPLTRLLFVFDASNSMNATWQSDRKITIARKLLSDAIKEVDDKPNVELGLRVYGHQVMIEPGKQDCDDTRLEVSFRPHNGALIQRTLNNLSPKGTTPIARSLEKAAGDFPECSNCRNIIILITDGIEACDGDPCAVSRALQKKGIILKPFVIGVGLEDEFKDTFTCVGNYFDATNEESFENILNIVINQALNNTTAQVNLLDDFGKPSETDVTVNFFNEATDQLEYGFVHTLNHRGNPDTISLDPIITYRLEAHTIPNIVKSNISIIPGKHNIIAVDAGQGDLLLKIEGQLGENIPVILRKRGKLETAHVLATNQRERILTGTYDLEVLTLPRTIIEEVKVSQDKITTVSIPEPGALNLSLSTPGYGSIAKVEGSALRWVVNLNPSETGQQFRLQPGTYKLTFRSKNSKNVVYTIEREFKINSGSSTNLKL